jgi:hypothetical protein
MARLYHAEAKAGAGSGIYNQGMISPDESKVLEDWLRAPKK